MSIPRRGYIAAGLAVAVAGSLGAFSTLNATADEIDAPPAPPAAAAAAGAATPPTLLPWGAKPTVVKRGRAGASSASLAATGADAAPNFTGPPKLRAGYSPKGFSSGKRVRSDARTTVPPRPQTLAAAGPTAAAKASAEPTAAAKAKKVRFHYATGFQYPEPAAAGTYANLVIGRPYLDKDDYHSLAEIAVQSRDGFQKVEAGWTVDRSLNGDEDPHFFVYHWVDDRETCYNKCGWVQYSKTFFPGDTLPVGTNKRFGIQFHNDAWWVAYESEWIGYFPAKNWGGRFTQGELIQWFGEVAADGDHPCSHMGTGVSVFDEETKGGGRFGTISLINGPELNISMRANSDDEDTKDVVEPAQYELNKLSERTFRFGGDGANGEADEKGKPYCK